MTYCIGITLDAGLVLTSDSRTNHPALPCRYCRIPRRCAGRQNPQGNYITTSEDTPYLQIGESKYGKFDAEDPYLTAIRHEWANQLNHAFRAMPRLETHAHPNGSLHVF